MKIVLEVEVTDALRAQLRLLDVAQSMLKGTPTGDGSVVARAAEEAAIRTIGETVAPKLLEALKIVPQ